MVQNNLIFASASFHPTRNNVLFKKKDLIKHEQEYLFCLEQLKRVVPENFEIYIVDNSIENSEDLISDNLRELLKENHKYYGLDISSSMIESCHSIFKKADIKNLGNGRLAGTITAGAFLKEFVGDTPWVHFDIAGTAWGPKEPAYQPKNGATGVAVRLVYSLLESRSK